MTRLLFAISLLMFVVGCKKTAAPEKKSVTPPVDSASTITYRSADLSLIPQIQQTLAEFFDSSSIKAPLDVLAEYGCNLAHVNLFYNPLDGHSGLSEVLGLCQQLKLEGIGILLDIHYSDTLADTAHQAIPAAWVNLSFSGLQDSVRAYTSNVISQLVQQNTAPAIVQIGNELNMGMLGNTGKVTGPSDANWANFAALLKSAEQGVSEAGGAIPIMINYAELDGAADFYTALQAHNVSFDIIGVSYFPWYSEKDTTYLQQQLNSLASTFNKQVFIAETAYPFTLEGDDRTPNVVTNNNQLIPGCFPTNDGQLFYLQQIKSILRGIPNKLGIGFNYWAADWVDFNGPYATAATGGTPAENVALFDFYGMATPGMQALQVH